MALLINISQKRELKVEEGRNLVDKDPVPISHKGN
jgi:hypothetical protein